MTDRHRITSFIDAEKKKIQKREDLKIVLDKKRTKSEAFKKSKEERTDSKVMKLFEQQYLISK